MECLAHGNTSGFKTVALLCFLLSSSPHNHHVPTIVTIFTIPTCWLVERRNSLHFSFFYKMENQSWLASLSGCYNNEKMIPVDVGSHYLLLERIVI